MSERAQTIMIWWGLITMFIYGFALWGLMWMVPPPAATLSVSDVAAFYQAHGTQIRLGAAITSWTSAFMVPFSVAVSIQMIRLEQGVPVWSMLQFAGGILMSIFLVLPPIFWGVAAFSPERAAEATTLMHELALLTLTTTDQFYIFQMVAITYLSLTQKVDPRSPFPRWLGYFTAWAALMFEVGALAFLFKKGPFSWNGLFVFWFPFVIFGSWVSVTSISMLRGIARQRAAKLGVAGLSAI